MDQNGFKQNHQTEMNPTSLYFGVNPNQSINSQLADGNQNIQMTPPRPQIPLQNYYYFVPLTIPIHNRTNQFLYKNSNLPKSRFSLLLDNSNYFAPDPMYNHQFG